MELSYLKFLYDNNINFISAESKQYTVPYELDGIKRNYFYDYILETGEHIEIKPKSLLSTIQNTAKFNVATEILGDKFKILTEDNIQKLTNTDIKYLHKTKQIKFIERYEIKFKERYYEHKNRT